MNTFWHLEFAKVIRCEKCHNPKLLRDAEENVPQPGYIGADYERTKLLLVGKKPSVPGDLETEDRVYTAALRALRDAPSPQRYEELRGVLEDFIPKWPFAQNFPLTEPDLTLKDIAILNLVRCRIKGNGNPPARIINGCRDTHFKPWLKMLDPKAVLFIGKWAHDDDRGGGKACKELGIYCDFIEGRGVSRADSKKMLAKMAHYARERVGKSI